MHLPQSIRSRFPGHASIGFAVVFISALLAIHISAAENGNAGEIAVVEQAVSSPLATNAAPHYTGNRQPLLPTAFGKLPIGAIAPRGWLRHQLELESQGMTGRLTEISPWCRFENNAWTDPRGKGHSGWEEMPYWLKGYADLGYVLKDEAIIREAKRWIEAALASQTADGWFGPDGLRTSQDGKPDLWPHMLMLNVMQSYYEYTADSRVLPFMENYFRWEMACPEQDFLTGYWPAPRGGDNLASVYWLYNRTGGQWLLELATKIHRHTSNWTAGIANWHGVNITQGFREPAIFYLQAKDKKFLDAAERNYQTVMGLYGQVPGGGFGADENCRPGYGDPRQGFETCSIVEAMHSFEMLTEISGNPVWSDRCEDLAFNSLPAALTPDFKALHYLTSPNMVQLDKENKAPGIQNGGTMISYSPLEVYRCCQHNVSHGWPYFAEELWLATSDKGLCASLYSACEVTAKVGDGSAVRVTETTDYPFSDKIEFKVSCVSPAKFPLYLRIPHWASDAKLKINGAAHDISAKPLSYSVVDREWKDGDIVELSLPMKLGVRTWAKNHNSVSVDYGPLTFSLAIDEKWKRYGGTDAWPEQEVYAASPWNYGLIVDAMVPARSFEIVHSKEPSADQPFTAKTAPIRLQAKARKILIWRQDTTGLVRPLQDSPVRTAEPIDVVTLIPMGAARLRISVFPTIGEGPTAHVWTLPPKPPTASYCNATDTLEAMNDGLLPARSSDESIPRFTWWDHKGTHEWVQYDFDEPRTIKSTDVYWFDDTGKGQCRVPKSWRAVYRDGAGWKPVDGAGDYEVAPNKFNGMKFKPVKTTAVRLEVDLQPEFSGGILEWKVE